MSTQNQILDELGRLMTQAGDVASGIKREVETAVKSHMEKVAMDMELVRRDDLEALRALIERQGEKIAALEKRVADLDQD